MIHDGKTNMDWKNYNKNFNQQITMDFWMTKFESYFPKFLFWSFFVELIFFPTNMYVKELSRWAAFHMDFINWLITI
jgi:adenylate cyclase